MEDLQLGLTSNARCHPRRDPRYVEIPAGQPGKFCRRLVDDDDDEAADPWRPAKQGWKCWIALKTPVIAGSAVNESKGAIAERGEIEGRAAHITARHGGQKLRR